MSLLLQKKKLYRGVAGYSNFIHKDAAEAASRSKVTGSHGPLRAPSNVRGIVRIDYAPDICKDYKETGFCGFGDSCKFLHDRGDYKMGWQIERDYDEQQRKKAKERAARAAAGQDPDADDADNPFLVREADVDGLPFACHLCREAFQSPIETQCHHYFCESCAIRHYAESPLCAICGKQTNGIFNPNPIKLLAKLRAAAAPSEDLVASSAPASKASSGSGWEVVNVDDEEDTAADSVQAAPIPSSVCTVTALATSVGATVGGTRDE